jgi:hypothetical protein
MKRIEETMARTREATERNALEVTELAEDVRSMRSLMRTAVVILVLLFVAVIGSVGFLLVKFRLLLH